VREEDSRTRGGVPSTTVLAKQPTLHGTQATFSGTVATYGTEKKLPWPSRWSH